MKDAIRLTASGNPRTYNEYLFVYIATGVHGIPHIILEHEGDQFYFSVDEASELINAINWAIQNTEKEKNEEE